ncbi:MAG: hypothetical protein WCF12_11240 [Propionicimonas sp.]
MDDNELLIRHAARWAGERGKALDPELLESALRLRSLHDGLAANRWPAKSVEHLMLVRWPAHGPQGCPDVPVLVTTLDTFWRFMRSTGRMAAASSEPKDLLREAKAAARGMPAACADPTNWSESKQLLDFGAEIGISMDDLADIDEANARLQRIMEAWNALPQEERWRRSPSAGNAGSRMGRALTDSAATWQHTGGLPAGWQLPQPPRLDDEPDEDEDLYPNDPKASAPQVRRSTFVQNALALADWVGSGREVTATNVLRPAVARAAYTALDLWAWERLWTRASGLDLPDIPEVDELAARTFLASWRTAAECLPLDRLWLAATAVGLISVGSRRATRGPLAAPATDAEWVNLGLGLVLGLTHRAQEEGAFDPLPGVLFAVSPRLSEPCTAAELREWWWNAPANTLAAAMARGPLAREISDRRLNQCLAMFDDCGLWITRGGKLVGTDFGWDFSLMLVAAIDSGQFGGWGD